MDNKNIMFNADTSKYLFLDPSVNSPQNGACHKSKADRIIEVDHRLNELKRQADQHLLSEEGIKKRKQRCWDVEPVFANIKNNHGFKRFMLRGKQKVSIEAGLLALAHNLRKKSSLEMAVFASFLK